MKYVFIGGVQIGKRALARFLDLGAEVMALFSLPDHCAPTVSGYANFDDLAREYGIPNHKIDGSINAPENVETIKKYNPDYILVIGCSQMIKKEILGIPRLGCVGHHPTLLPRNRGRAPIPWTLIHGLEYGGVTMFFLDPGVDTGDILIQKKFKVDYEDDAASLYEKISAVTVELAGEAFPLLESGDPPRIRQDHSMANTWPRRRPEDGIMDWNKTSLELYNWVRGLTHPFPGAFSHYKGKKLFIWKCAEVKQVFSAPPGTMVKGSRSDDPVVSCNGGGIRLLRVQPEGEQEIAGAEWMGLKGAGIGERFDVHGA